MLKYFAKATTITFTIAAIVASLLFLVGSVIFSSGLNYREYFWPTCLFVLTVAASGEILQFRCKAWIDTYLNHLENGTSEEGASHQADKSGAYMVSPESRFYAMLIQFRINKRKIKEHKRTGR
jgi:hypothetical protein